MSHAGAGRDLRERICACSYIHHDGRTDDDGSGRKMSATILFLAVVLTASTQLAHATIVEWYRTSQDTSDRITAQPSIAFGDDFASDISVTINRLAHSAIHNQLYALSKM